jgi:hypothetical protein
VILKNGGESLSVSHLSSQLLRIPSSEAVYARSMRRMLARRKCWDVGSLPSFIWKRLDVVVFLGTAFPAPLEVSP